MRYPVQILYRKGSQWEKWISGNLLIENAHVYSVSVLLETEEVGLIETTFASTISEVIEILKTHENENLLMVCVKRMEKIE